jgi:hypothetical protein
MVMLCVALSRAAYDSPVKSAHNLSILFNIKPFRNILQNISNDEPILLKGKGFSGNTVGGGSSEPIKKKYSGTQLYKQVAAYINWGSDLVSKKGPSEKTIKKAGGLGMELNFENHSKILTSNFYKDKNIFVDQLELTKTPSKIRSFFICTINDLNCYVSHHADFNVIFVYFRGTLSVKSAMKDARVSRKKINTTGNEGMTEGEVHMGFLENLDQGFQRICYCIAKLQEGAKGRCRVITTGHSLGGALTTLFSYLYSKYYKHLKSLCEGMPRKLVPFEKISCVAVSAPKLGDIPIANNFNAQMNNGKIEFVNIFNRGDIVPKVPKATGTAKWKRPGQIPGAPAGLNNPIILCYNSSISPVTTSTRYKGDLKCTWGKKTKITDIFKGSMNAHLYVYFINFTANLRSALQTRPEKEFLRMIYWTGGQWKSLFIDDWRCNNVLNKPNYENEMVNGISTANNKLVFKAKGHNTILSIRDSGKTGPNSVRYRKYNRTCNERENKGMTTKSSTLEGRKEIIPPYTTFLPSQKLLGTSGGKRRTRKRRRNKRKKTKRKIKSKKHRTRKHKKRRKEIQ